MMNRCIPVLFLSLYLLFFSPLFANEDSHNPSRDARERETKAFTIGEIVIRGLAVASIEEAGTTTEITDEDIRAHGHKNLADALAIVPGIKVDQGGHGWTQFTLRGFQQRHLTILIDGVPIVDSFKERMDISRIPIENVARIVITRGVTSALYGASGAVGSVNIITKRPEKPFARITAEYGEHENYNLSVAHGMPIGNFYYWITAALKNSDGYEVSEKLDRKERREWVEKLSRFDLYGRTISDINIGALDDYLSDFGTWPNTGFRKYQIAGKMGYEITPHLEFGISADYYTGEQKGYSPRVEHYSSYDADSSQWSNPVYPDDYDDTVGDNRSLVFTGNYSDFPEDYSYTVSPYLSYKDRDFSVKGIIFYREQRNLYLSYSDAAMTVFSWPEIFVGPWIDRSCGLRLLSSYKIVSWNKINMAVMYRYDDHKEKTRDEDMSKASVLSQEFSLAFEDEMRLGNLLKLVIGVSYDARDVIEIKQRPADFSGAPFFTWSWGEAMVDQYIVEDNHLIWGTTDAFNPVLGVVYEPIRGFLKFRGTASMKSKFPNLDEYLNVVEGYRLKVERSHNASTGFEFLFLQESLSFRTDYFFTHFKDKIEFAWAPGETKPKAGNIGKVTTHGVETSVSGKHRGIGRLLDMSYTISYTYVRRRNENDVPDSEFNRGNLEELIPEHQLMMDLRFLFVTGTSLNISGIYDRGAIQYAMEEAPVDGLIEKYSTRYFEPVRLHNPIKVNIRLSQELFERFTIHIMCKNVLDDYDSDPFNPGPGRMFYFGGDARL
jgi:outer membrane cobalamin receptor